MIPNQWYAVLESSELKPGKPLGVTRLGEKLVLWRETDGRPACLQDLCVHRGAALSLGKVVGECVECPFHGFQYDPSGRCRLIPANGRATPVPKAFQIRPFPCREAHNFIWVWWGDPEKATGDVPWFETIDDSFSHATFRDHWNVHYSRAIENQLDVVHLPFVHYNTIGRGGRTLVNGPLVRWEEAAQSASRRMNIWVYNQLDEGKPALRPEELPEPIRHPSLQFQFPNTWHNWISDAVRIMVAFAPIDEDNTLVYVRFYQQSVRIPVLRDLFNLAAMPLNVVILRQDKRVVLTQRPKKTDLRMGEKLIQGDGPIVAYRRERSHLMETQAAPR